MFIDGPMVPTRLEGMETRNFGCRKSFSFLFRPDLRGWKLLFLLNLSYILSRFRPDLRGWKPCPDAASAIAATQFRPDLRGWKPRLSFSGTAPLLGSDPT